MILFFIQRADVVFENHGENTSYNYLKKSGSASTNSPALSSKFLFGRLSTFLQPFTNKFNNINKQTHEEHSIQVNNDCATSLLKSIPGTF